MGLFDRVRDLFGSGGDDRAGTMDDEETQRYPTSGVDETSGQDDGGEAAPPHGDVEGRGRSGVNAPAEGQKSGSHGSHWDTVVHGDDAIMQSLMGTIETGESTPGRTVGDEHVLGYRAGSGPLGTVALVSEAGELWSGYPVGAGIGHEVVIDGMLPWANGAEAQLSGDLGDATVSFFATNYWAHEDGHFGGPRQVELAAFAYDLNPAEAETITDEEGNEFSTAGMAAFVPFDGGDVDDYIFQTHVETVTTCEFDGTTVYRLRVPLFVDPDGGEYHIMLYAAEHVCDGYVPEKGDDVEGVFWLQGRVEG
ncbi:hypothetical protein [Haloarchaeobius sp. DFWS5]|uniref:hypothetical protein n=1 Tax=Haloarchaeobius sp. DFWS5 TaxID=3446114 RepID=UPI003EB7CA90